jgi:hypothetical protein
MMRRAFLLVGGLLWSVLAGAQSVYFGNLHSHTSYSDGSGTPDEAFTKAKGAGLDFFAITEHNHPAADGKGPRRDGLLIATRPELYAGQPTSLLESANRHNSPGSFVAIYGQEVSTISQGNHINVFGVGSVIDIAAVPNGNVTALLNWVSTHPDGSGRPPLLQFNHPRDPDRNLKDYGRDDFAPADWVRSLDPFVELIEVLNAPALRDGEGFRAEAKESYYLDYLNLGFHVGPSVGHDNHWKNWGVSTDARVGVVASSLTRDAIMAALRARHTTASDDKNLKVIFRSGEALGGDIVSPTTPGTALPLTVEIVDPDEPNARYRVDVLTDHPGGDRARRPINSIILNGNTPGRAPLEGIPADGPGQFVLLKITQSSAERGDEEHEEQEDRLWTAPIWYESSAPASIASVAVTMARLLPNPAGDEVRNETVTLTNAGSVAVSLAGWQVRDASGNVWTLGGQILPGADLTILRNGQPMSLNNDGDVVELIDGSGRTIDAGRYGRAPEGRQITLERL